MRNFWEPVWQSATDTARGAILVASRSLPEDLQQAFLESYEQQSFDVGERREVLRRDLQTLLNLWRGYLDVLPGKMVDACTPVMATRQFTKRFGPVVTEKIEAEFITDHFQLTRTMTGFFGPVLIGFNICWAILDRWCLPETWSVAWSIRLVICLVVGAGMVFRWRMAMSYQRFYQTVPELSLVTAVVGIIGIIVQAQPGEMGHDIYYAGLMLLLLLTASLSGLRTDAVCRFCGVLVVTYMVTVGALEWPIFGDADSLLRLSNDMAFLGGGSILTIFGVAWQERSLRLRFMIRYILIHTLGDFVRFFDGGDVAQLQEVVSRLQYQPMRLQRFLDQAYPASLLLAAPKVPVAQLPGASPFEENESSEASAPVEGLDTPIDGVLKAGWDRAVRYGKAVWAWCFSEEEFLSFRAARSARQAYKDDYFYGAIVPFRLGILIGLGTYVSFAVLDWLTLPETRSFSVPLRLVFTAVGLGSFILSFFEAFFKKAFLLIMTPTVFAVGMTLILMIARANPFEPGYRSYYVGLINIYLYLCVLSRLRFVPATLTVVAITVFYNVVILYVEPMPLTTSNVAALANNNLFLVGACLIVAIAMKFQELFKRDELFARYCLIEKSREILEIQESVDMSPQELWDLFTGFRYSPQKIQELINRILSHKG
ncbi:hypothetical protein PN498_13330 [Oscillatoria sp. CS-180]|uniref:hypothetical protein n=1 Tax=Oscillatoria sp. CS-180 TaxID=3021720 RepID=UPI00232E209A|nr:hypothetical protein [Oscillatoria sp. CS-180]MDB9526976.1 hypothetical protein [Oscillatoria sp. CS-180]